MIALNQNSNFIKEIERLQAAIASNKENSFVLKLYSFFAKRNKVSQLRTMRKNLISAIDIVDDEKFVPTKEIHAMTKNVLSLIKQTATNTIYLTNATIEALTAEVTALGYTLEKKVRIKLYANQPPKETSDFAKAVSSISLDATAKNL